MESSPLRVIPLLSISSPCRGILFFRYKERTRRRLVLEAEFRRKAGLWLWFCDVYIYYNSLVLIYVLYKRELTNSFEIIGYSCCIMMSIVIRPKWSFYLCCDYIRLLETGFMQMLYLGRAPRTKETLPDFLKWRRVTRHPHVFRGLTGSQRTPGFGASQHQLYTIVQELINYSLFNIY